MEKGTRGSCVTPLVKVFLVTPRPATGSLGWKWWLPHGASVCLLRSRLRPVLSKSLPQNLTSFVLEAALGDFNRIPDEARQEGCGNETSIFLGNNPTLTQMGAGRGCGAPPFFPLKGKKRPGWGRPLQRPHH